MDKKQLKKLKIVRWKTRRPGVLQVFIYLQPPSRIEMNAIFGSENCVVTQSSDIVCPITDN